MKLMCQNVAAKCTVIILVLHRKYNIVLELTSLLYTVIQYFKCRNVLLCMSTGISLKEFIAT